MRHKIGGWKLNRTTEHRIALIRNLSQALITHEQIKTTLPKAKMLRPHVEKLITLAKENTLHTRRLAASKLQSEDVAKKLITEVGPRFKNRNGGYLRIIRAGYRYGDNAPMAIIQMVEDLPEAAAKPKKKKAAPAAKAAAPKAEVKAEEVVVEEIKAEETVTVEEATVETPAQDNAQEEAKAE